MLPRAIEPFVDFASVLRAHGFAVAPDQTSGFIEAIGLLGPRHMDDIHRAALSMLAIPHEREPEFDALFRAFFMGQTVSAPASAADEEEEVEAFEASEGESEVPEGEEIEESGAEATIAESLSQRSFGVRDNASVLRDFARRAPARLPRRLSYRRSAARHGDRLNMRKALREAVQRDG
ncbi:MAG: hypothetical protein V7703_20540, partial [Hyphomicrobiales bacterium]